MRSECNRIVTCGFMSLRTMAYLSFCLGRILVEMRHKLYVVDGNSDSSELMKDSVTFPRLCLGSDLVRMSGVVKMGIPLILMKK